MGFRTKLVLSYIFLIALITGSFYLYVNHTLQKEMIEESRANLASQTQLARLLVMSSRQGTAPQQLAELIGTVIKARVTLDRTGRYGYRRFRCGTGTPGAAGKSSAAPRGSGGAEERQRELPSAIPTPCGLPCFTRPQRTAAERQTVSFALRCRWNTWLPHGTPCMAWLAARQS